MAKRPIIGRYRLLADYRCISIRKDSYGVGYNDEEAGIYSHSVGGYHKGEYEAGDDVSSD